jgi:peptide/nickel transport system ATP-binding protein
MTAEAKMPIDERKLRERSNCDDTPLLRVDGLCKRFPADGMGKRELRAVEDFSIELGRGEVLALVGESGSGKTTATRMIARLVEPTAGSVLLDGADVLAPRGRAAQLAFRRRVQYIFQDPFASLNPVHTIGHHLERPLLLHGLAEGGKGLDERVRELLEAVELRPAAEIAARYPHQLSGGQRQRVSIARALAVMPDLILADEPISMLDVSIRMGVLNLINSLKAERGIAFVYITHDLASARYVSDTIAVMYAGRLVEGGPGEEVLRSPAHPYTRLLLSAVPDPRAGLRTGAEELPRGDLPSLIDPPPGCLFAARCREARAACRSAQPARAELGGGHWAACHLYGGAI